MSVGGQETFCPSLFIRPSPCRSPWTARGFPQFVVRMVNLGMKIHMYEFRSEKKKLKCSCGWERTLKTADVKLIAKTFSAHQVDMAAKPVH